MPRRSHPLATIPSTCFRTFTSISPSLSSFSLLFLLLYLPPSVTLPPFIQPQLPLSQTIPPQIFAIYITPVDSSSSVPLHPEIPLYSSPSHSVHICYNASFHLCFLTLSRGIIFTASIPPSFTLHVQPLRTASSRPPLATGHPAPSPHHSSEVEDALLSGSYLTGHPSPVFLSRPFHLTSHPLSPKASSSISIEDRKDSFCTTVGIEGGGGEGRAGLAGVRS